MSIPSIGPSLPSTNPAPAQVAQAAQQAAANAQSSVNNAAAQMGAQNALAPAASSAAANLAAGLQSAQISTPAAAGQSAGGIPTNPAPSTALGANVPTAESRMDTAFLTTGNPTAGNPALPGKAASEGSLAKMLQSFSQATTGAGTASGAGASVSGGTNLAGNALASGNANLVANPQGGGATNPTSTAPGTTQPGPNQATATNSTNPNATATNLADAVSTKTSAQTSNNATNTANATKETAAGAATLRAQATSGGATTATTATAQNPTNPQAVLGGENPAQNAARQAQSDTAATVTQLATEAKTAASQSLAAQTTRAQGARPDASMVAGVPAPLTNPDPAPKAGQIGLSTANPSDPLSMAQAAAASGFSYRLQQSLNINLGLPGITPGSLISAVGLFIVTLVMLRVFVNGLVEEDVVGLSFATIIGIGLMIAPWLMKERR